MKTILARFRTFLSLAWTQCNESALGIRTGPLVPRDNTVDEPWKGEFSPNAINGDNFRYETMGYWNLRKLLQIIKPSPADVVYDIGCGMGRILCLAARTPVRKCVGIELMEPLCEIARRNAANLRGRKAPIEIVCGDASTADLSEGTIYFLFNPFGPQTLRDTFENIRQSLLQKPRSIRIVYYHSKYCWAVEDLKWLLKVRDFESFGGHPVTIWHNRESAELENTDWVYLKIEGGVEEDHRLALGSRDDEATIVSKAQSEQIVHVATNEFSEYRWLAVPRTGPDRFVVEGKRR